LPREDVRVRLLFAKLTNVDNLNAGVLGFSHARANFKRFGASIRTRRKVLGWTQAELATAVGVTRAWIISVERGKATVELYLVLRTLAALGLVADIGLAPPAHGKVDLDKHVEQYRLGEMNNWVQDLGR
jgi:y4mF family transcriptional regulator